MQIHFIALIVVIVNIGCIHVAVCEGPWCYVCDKAVKPGSCGEIIKCSDDEQCYASSDGVNPTQYTAGCRKKQLCQGSVSGGSSPHGCEECCYGDHCNSDLCGGLPLPQGSNRLCLQCEAVLHPSQCFTVSRCGQDKYCTIWKRFRFATTYYDLGCLEKTQCDGHMKGEDELSHGGFICCNDDLCNSHENSDHLTLAPSQSPTVTSQPGTVTSQPASATTAATGSLLCKTCASIQQPHFCQIETQCGPDQYCSVRRVFRFGMTFYSLGCEEKTKCEDHMKNLGEAGFRCCKVDLCNANINPVIGITTQAVTSPGTPGGSTTPSLATTTTVRSGILMCKTCEIVQEPTLCHRETECGLDQYCSVRRVFTFGLTFYRLGCEEKTVCVGHMKTLDEGGFRCCNEDRCNANVDPQKPSSLTPMAPGILNMNDTVDAILGKTFLLLCNVTGNPEPSVTWSYDKQANPNAHPKGSTLAISSVNEKNEGQYNCIANNTLGTKESIFHLHVTEPVSVKLEPPVVVISPGMGAIRLKCVGGGLPAPAVTLSKLGGDITADKFFGHVNPAEILLIRITEANMMKFDGVYICNATSGNTSVSAYQIVAGNVTSMIGENIPFNNISTTPLKAFHVLCPPGLTKPDASPTTTEFDLDELICASARKIGLLGTEAGSVTWLIRPDGKAQFLNGSMNVDFEQGHTSPNTPASSAPSTTSSVPLTAPDILNTNQTVNAILGETVLLFCNASGNPPPSVTWKYDESVSPNAHPKGSMLAISSVNEKNEGIYKCVANNTLGTKEGIVHLNVKEPVSVKGEPPLVVISPGMRFARLKCVGEGIPPPSVTLSKYGEDISADKSYHPLGSAEILIMGITEANMLNYDGVYVCNATNGQTSSSAYQIVASNVSKTLGENLTFENVSTTPLKAFHAWCPSGHEGTDGSPIIREFNLDEAICSSARQVGLINTKQGHVTWLIRPDGKAQFLNGSLNVDFGQLHSTAVMTTPSASVSASERVTPPQSSMLSPSPLQPSTMSNIQNVGSLTTVSSYMVTSREYTASIVTPNSSATNVHMTNTLTPSVNVISTHSSFLPVVNPTSQSLFLPFSHTTQGPSYLLSSTSLSSAPRVSTTSLQPLSVASYSSNQASRSHSILGTYTSNLEASLSVLNTGNPSLVMTVFPSNTLSSSSRSMFAPSRAPSRLQVSTVPSILMSAPVHSSALAPSKAISSSQFAIVSASSLALTSLPISLTSQAIVGSYASSRAVLSSKTTSISSPGSVASTPAMNAVPSGMIMSSHVSAGTSTAASSSGIASSSEANTPSMSNVPSSMILSPQITASAYTSSTGLPLPVSASGTISPSLAVNVLRPGTTSPQARTVAGVSSISMSAPSSPSSLTPSVVPYSVIKSPIQTKTGEHSSPSQTSAGTITSSSVASTHVIESTATSFSSATTALSLNMIMSSQVSAGAYVSSVSSSASLSSATTHVAGVISSSPSPSLASLPSSGTSSSDASASAYVSSSGMSSFGMAMTPLPSSLTSSSGAGASAYVTSRGATVSGITSSSPSLLLAMTSLPSSVTSSSDASAGTYASSRGVSSSGMASRSPSPSLTMTSSKLKTSSDVSVGAYASSRGVSSSGMASSSPSPTRALTSLPSSLTSSSDASAGTYASSRSVSSSGMASSSPSLSLAMVSLPSSVSVSAEASAGTSASSRAATSSVTGSSSSPPAIDPSSTILTSQSKTGEMFGSESLSKALQSFSSTFPMSVTGPSVSPDAHLLPSISLMNKHTSSHLIGSLAGLMSFTTGPTLTSSLSRQVTVSSLPQMTMSGSPLTSTLLPNVISPSSSRLSLGQSTAVPGTYKQESTTEATTVTTTEPRVAPYISNPSQNVNGQFGENVVLTCDVGGFPEPSISWVYDDKKIFNAYAVYNNLTLTYVTKDNNGVYTCVAVNSAGAANGTIQFKISNPILVNNPVVILDPTNMINQLECSAKGDPVPKITWTKYGGGLNLTTDDSVSAFEDGDLLLTGVSKSSLHIYQGVYICHADNGAKDAYVVAAESISETQDSSKKFGDVSIRTGAAFHATCDAGAEDADGSPLSTTFGPGDSICDSARRVGVLDKASGPVTWFIRTDGKAEFVTETEGGHFPNEAPDAQDTAMYNVASKPVALKAPVTCETCAGPTCGVLPGRDTQCPSTTPFCMNTVVTKADGSKLFTKSCASTSDCETLWWQLTSSDERCTEMQPGNPYMADFTCSYCCSVSKCNLDVIPPKDTLYTGMNRDN